MRAGAAAGPCRRAKRPVVSPYRTTLEAQPQAGSPPVGELFAELTASLSGGDDLESLLQRFLEPVLRLSGAQAGAVRALTDDGLRMRLVGSVGLPPALLLAEQEVDRHCGTCGRALDEGRLTWTGDLRPCRQHAPGASLGDGFAQLMAVPLRHREQVLGIYNLFFERDTPPRADIAAVLRSVGELLGLALHHARLEREQLRAAVLHERQMLANEVHDAVAQTLVFMKMRLPLLQDALRQHDDPRALKYHDDLRQAVTDAHASLREILTHYRTRMDPKGLLHALRALQAGYLDRHGIELSIDAQAAAPELSVEQEVQVFHIVQEALANVAKHSQARRARVTVERTAGALRFVVEDDGAGLLSADAAPCAAGADAVTHFGMEIMRERAQRLGGTLYVQSRPVGGTRVCLHIPLDGAEAASTP
jgi:two-component system, NarL family, nitrate/nitrite sensor histidine kinase NarX